MNDAHTPVGKAVDVGILGLDHPQSSGRIGFIPDCRVPVHEGTRVFNVSIREFKEEVNASDEEASHPRSIRVPSTDEDAVPSWGRDVTFRPPRCGANRLSVHPSWAGRVAGGTKCCSS